MVDSAERSIDDEQDRGLHSISADDGGALYAVLLTLGLSASVFSLCIMMVVPQYDAFGFATFEERYLIDLILELFAFLWIVASRAASAHLVTKTGMHVLVGVAFAGSILSPFLMVDGLWVIGVALMAAGIVALVFLWWSHACTLGRATLTVVLTATAFITAAGLCAAGTLFKDSLQLDYVKSMASLASCMLLLMMKNNTRDRLLKVTIAESCKRRRNAARSRIGRLNYFNTGLILGVDSGLLLIASSVQGNPTGVPLTVAIGAVLFGVAAFFAICCLVPRFDFERVTKDYLATTLALGYLLLPLVGGIFFFAVGWYLVVLVLIQLFIIFLAGAELVRFEQLSPLYSFGEVSFIAAGSIAGSLAAIVVKAVFPSVAMQVLCMVAILCVSAVQVQLNKVTFPVEEWAVEEGGELDAASAPFGADVQLGRFSDAPEAGQLYTDAVPGGADPFIPEGSYLRACLDGISEQYRLSPRQREILDLLVRGRDTQYIMDYFTISRATAKTHVYNIYRKLDIHSRQDLYDLVEKGVGSEKES